MNLYGSGWNNSIDIERRLAYMLDVFNSDCVILHIRMMAKFLLNEKEGVQTCVILRIGSS